MSTIATDTTSMPTPHSVVQLLDSLRRRIRWYVVIEGTAMLIVWLILAFWVGLAADYLPVLVGASEMPLEARKALLVITLIGAFGVLYYYILRRVFSPLRDASLALLVERQFPSFRDSLVTTVEINDKPQAAIDQADYDAIALATNAEASHLGKEMLVHTVQRAQANLADVSLSKVFRYRPIASKVLLAVAAIASLVWFAVSAREAFGIGASRLVLLSNDIWPRRAQIEMVGFDEHGQKKIAKGTDLVVRVRADAARPYPPPELCSIIYETDDGDRGRVNMSRDGEPRDGHQYYVFSGKPFKGVLNDIRFDVVGFDHRLKDQHVKVVLSPVVTSVSLRSELPAYTGLLPREETWAPGMQLPIGSKVTATIQASKDLVAAKIRDIDSDEEQIIRFGSEQRARVLVHQVEELTGRVALSISLQDTDGIESLEPFLMTIGALEDQVPKVDMALRGIGNAITNNARLPVEGSISDDYQIDRSWFHLKVGDLSREFDFVMAESESLALDLREEASASRTQPLALEPQDRLVFAVKASDRYDLQGESHIGASETRMLTVVRPDELLAILDGRELGLRRRFEQIRTEMIQSRDSLARLRASFKEESNENESESASNEDAVDPQIASQNLADLRDRWASWAAQKADQTVLEVEGITLAFEDIREELTNNRVDTPERKSRMEQQIIAPLRLITSEQFPRYAQSIALLRSQLASTDPSAEGQSITVLEHADEILVAMEAVLDKMLELEDYAELVNIVRQLIEQQENLQRQTEEQQTADVLDLLK